MGVLLIAVTSWTLVAAKRVTNTADCIVDHYDAILQAPLPQVNNQSDIDAARQATEEFSADMIKLVKRSLTSFVAGVTLPGYLLALFALIAASLSISAIKCEGTGWAQGAKVIVFLAILVSLVALVTFMLSAILGLAAGSPTIESQYDEGVTQVCVDSRKQIVKQMGQTAKAKKEACATPGQACEDATTANEYVMNMSVNFDDICQCSKDWLSQAKEMAAPGIIGVILSFATLIVVSSLCSTMACCKNYKANIEDGKIVGPESSPAYGTFHN